MLVQSVVKRHITRFHPTDARIGDFDNHYCAEKSVYKLLFRNTITAFPGCFWSHHG